MASDEFHRAALEHLDALYNFAINGAMILHGTDRAPVRSGDEIDVVPSIAGG